MAQCASALTSLDGARGKKQVWRPHVRTWGLPEANVLYWKNTLVTLLGLFEPSRSDLVPPQWFGAQGIVSPCPPRYAPAPTDTLAAPMSRTQSTNSSKAWSNLANLQLLIVTRRSSSNIHDFWRANQIIDNRS